MEKPIDILLVELPFSQYAMPVYSLSLLKGCLNRAGLESRVIYGNMRFSLRTGVAEYLKLFSWIPMRLTMGDMVFAEAAHGGDIREAYREQISKESMGGGAYHRICYEVFTELEKQAVPFIAELGEEILAQKPKIVGMSSVFFQNNACIALAKYIKERNPDIITLFGGGNSVCESAWAAVKYNRCIDYAFSGEADECFADFCTLLLSGQRPTVEEIPFGILRADMDMDGKAVPIRRTAELDGLPYPDYDDYFAELERLGLRSKLSPALLMEFSRGCWWNEKKPCSFCGLNNGNLHYRTKSAERIIAELKYLQERYGSQVRKVMLVDNILSRYHVKELLPRLAVEPCGFALMSEVKSNMTIDELRLFKRAGFTMLQPGIESLQDDVLELMNKGNRAIKHIELLKNFADEGMTVVWNYLAGFPGEKPEWYKETAELVPLITHLKAPTFISRIFFNRGSEYLRHPERYGLKLQPLHFYELAYPDEGYRESAAIMYELIDEAGNWIDDRVVLHSPEHVRAVTAISEWRHSFYEGNKERLTMADDGNTIAIMDMRGAAVGLYYSLTGLKREIALLTGQVIGRSRLIEVLAGKYTAEEIEREIGELKAKKLLLEIRGELLFLALQAEPAAKAPDELCEPGFFYDIPSFPAEKLAETGEK